MTLPSVRKNRKLDFDLARVIDTPGPLKAIVSRKRGFINGSPIKLEVDYRSGHIKRSLFLLSKTLK